MCCSMKFRSRPGTPKGYLGRTRRHPAQELFRHPDCGQQRSHPCKPRHPPQAPERPQAEPSKPSQQNSIPRNPKPATRNPSGPAGVVGGFRSVTIQTDLLWPIRLVHLAARVISDLVVGRIVGRPAHDHHQILASAEKWKTFDPYLIFEQNGVDLSLVIVPAVSAHPGQPYLRIASGLQLLGEGSKYSRSTGYNSHARSAAKCLYVCRCIVPSANDARARREEFRFGESTRPADRRWVNVVYMSSPRFGRGSVRPVPSV